MKWKNLKNLKYGSSSNLKSKGCNQTQFPKIQHQYFNLFRQIVSIIWNLIKSPMIKFRLSLILQSKGQQKQSILIRLILKIQLKMFSKIIQKKMIKTKWNFLNQMARSLFNFRTKKSKKKKKLVLKFFLNNLSSWILQKKS